MGIINMVKEIKEIYPEYILLIRVGVFYNVYGKDSYIISYLFNYKLAFSLNTFTCAFPVKNIDNVTDKLEQRKINYMILDRRNNYDVEKKSNNNNQNKYKDTYIKAREKINYDFRVQRLVEFLKENRQDKKILQEMEQIIERREVQSN